MAVCTEEAVMEAFVTLATNDEYAIGALVLGHSLREVGTTRSLVVLTTLSVSSAMSQQLRSVFDVVKVVDLLDSRDAAHLELMSRPELGVTLTKINCWKLTQFTKCVFLDADTLVLQNIDDLFEREEFSAAPDIGWPDCFNSGVFVFRPSDKTYTDLVNFMNKEGSFDGGDQGLLNSFFSDWATKDIRKHLPFVYNVVTQTFYSYMPALKRFGKDVRVVHFIGSQKPWHVNAENVASSEGGNVSGSAGPNAQFIKLWWKTFSEKIQPTLQVKEEFQKDKDVPQDPKNDNIVASENNTEHYEAKSSETMAETEKSRQMEWEKGEIDYMGMDRFENILKQLDETMYGGDSKQTKEPLPSSKQFP